MPPLRGPVPSTVTSGKWDNVQPEPCSQPERKLRMGGQPQSAEAHKTSISPMLSVRNGAKAIEFYKGAFGAAELFRVGDENGVVAQLSVGGAEFWVADES